MTGEQHTTSAATRPIIDLDLGVRATNCLRRVGIRTVAELLRYTESDLLDIRNFGTKSLIEVKTQLRALGFELATDPTPDHPRLEAVADPAGTADALPPASTEETRPPHQVQPEWPPRQTHLTPESATTADAELDFPLSLAHALDAAAGTGSPPGSRRPAPRPAHTAAQTDTDHDPENGPTHRTDEGEQ